MATEVEQQRAEELLAEAKQKYGSSDFEGAIALLDEVIEFDPKNADAWNDRGVAKRRLHRYEEAIKDYDESISLKPDDYLAWFRRGIAKYHLGRQIDTTKDFDEAARLDSDDESLSSQDLANLRLEHYEGAIKDFGKAIELNPEYATTWSYRGAARRRLGKDKEAIVDLNEAIKLEPDSAVALNHRGWVNYALGNLGQARTDFQLSIKINPQEADAQDGIIAVEKRMEAEKILRSNERQLLNREKWTKYGIWFLNVLIVVVWVVMVIIIIVYALAVFPEPKKIIGFIENKTTMMSEIVPVGEVAPVSETITTSQTTMSQTTTNETAMSETITNETRTISEKTNEVLAPNSESDEDATSIFLEKLFLISPLLILIFPFIWGIRMLNTAKDKQEIMREDYYRRALIDSIMRQVFDPFKDDTPELQEQKRKVWAESLRGWLHHSPAEMLLQIHTKSKSNTNKNQSPHEQMVSEVRKTVEASLKGDGKK